MREFRRAAERFRSVAGDSNDLYRSREAARELLNRAQHVGRMLNRLRVDSRTGSTWDQLRHDLRAVADIYGLRFRDSGGYYGRDDDWRRNGGYRY